MGPEHQLLVVYSVSFASCEVMHVCVSQSWAVPWFVCVLPAVDCIPCTPEHLFWSERNSLLHFCFGRTESVCAPAVCIVPYCILQESVCRCVSVYHIPFCHHGHWRKAPACSTSTSAIPFAPQTIPSAALGSLRDQLLHFTLRSRDDPGRDRLAANSLSLLNAAAVLLSGLDLRGVRAPGAHLEGAQLHGADLRGACLPGANLRGAVLDCADLRGADLAGARATPLLRKWPAAGPVNRVALAPGGRLLASALQDCEDQSIALWDVATGAAAGALVGHTGTVWGLAIPVDERLLSSAEDSTVRLWDLDARAPLRTIETGADWVLCCAMAPRGAVVACGAEEAIQVWGVEGALVRTLEGHARDVTCLAMSGDGRVLASGSDDRTVRMWGVAGGEALAVLQGHTSCVAAVALSADGGTVVSGSMDKRVCVWQAATGALLRTLEGHRGYVNGVAVSGDGQTVVSGCEEQTVRVWNASTGALLRTMEGHTKAVRAVLLLAAGAGAGAGAAIASASEDGTIRFWELEETAELVRPQEGPLSGFVHAVAVAGDGDRIVSGEHDGTVRIWSAWDGSSRAVAEGHAAAARAVAVSRDGLRAASGGDDALVRVWDVSDGRLQATLEGHRGSPGEQSSVTSVALSADGTVLASGSEDQTVRVWALPSADVVGTFALDTEVRSVALSDDGRVLVAALRYDFFEKTKEKRVMVWDARTREVLRTVDGEGYAAVPAPDGRTVASAGADKRIRVTVVATGETAGEWDSGGTVYSLAFAGDGRLLVSGGCEGVVQVWDVVQGALVRTLEGHADAVWSVAVTPDARTVVSGSSDRTVRVWRMGDGRGGTGRGVWGGLTDPSSAEPEGQGSAAEAVEPSSGGLWQTGRNVLCFVLKACNARSSRLFASKAKISATTAMSDVLMETLLQAKAEADGQ